ncbi:uncharacterized protein SPPG_06539 [Spizellomyces punctatus DAOM BR117]|uniref:Uncharacterized protein n=1 Tax=Spizellomyces punctatus (strain DAOM BR117) TaxID=645134 RepID=A0A0L0HAG1_SPIPD|nr:uncharacterized protein SPPG_06539 [Spizellomyces punctatus DAOM BR117]KNC98132.1 hypothetical protein SPPG_06539 [Spizellomyces punctatus DAOM BR117]|eukprot:XP_016606172.1 hypothetical protein SPPG_06539 [Spizellomyces punctatus DAOM BR117]
MLFKAVLRPLAARPAVASRALVAPQRRMASTSVFAADNFKKYVPDVRLTGETTLGEIYEKAYVRYRYRLLYPIAAWVGFLYYYLWVPYAPESEKKAVREREEYLKSLEYHSV